MKYLFILFFYSLSLLDSSAQTYLHTKGKNIVTSDGKPFLIKGIKFIFQTVCSW